MKPGVLALNTARGGLLNEATCRALETGQLAAWGWTWRHRAHSAGQPPPPRSQLHHHPPCGLVPKETRQRLLDFAVENLRCYLAGRPINVIGGPGKL